ncbi:sulfatase [Planctomicrobium piriforme]|uniref:Arylsulfatase A n=1 Tax=Planctomicrobium piriforme TaxID=1576369 RepID=A0A1I3KSM7_9PLAN|nr:sulfatase [Planctomicrobium piriforme]SFI75519.1 Arylsulfatase A [Planctomicrobium piriforme]
MSLKLLTLLSLILIWIAILTQAAPAADRPNVVVMLVDDMGIMDTSVPFLTDANGQPQRYPLNDFYRTPNMERLAPDGIRFSNFYAMSVCSPTRVSIMTGQNAARHHTTNWINPDQNNGGPRGPADWNWRGLGSANMTLPRLLQAAGYRTIQVGKGHFGPREAEGADPRSLGFDVKIGGDAMGQPGSYLGEENYGAGGKRASRAVPDLEKYHGTKTFLTSALTLEAEAQIDQAVADKKPFFLYFAQYAVHAPFQSDPRFAAHYEQSGKPANAQAFAALVEGMDESLGEILKHLKSLGIADNTVIFFLGDNGTDAPLGNPHDIACAAPLRGKKGSHYEGGVRVPFIAAWAQPNPDAPAQKSFPIARGAIQSQAAAVMDLFPTILELAQVPVPAGVVVDGKPLNKLLTGVKDDSRAETFLMHYPHSPHRSDYFTLYREGDWKVIYHYFPSPASSGSHYQLFNLATDPSESDNLAEREPMQLRSMMQQLAASLKEHDAQYPVDRQTGQPALPVIP